MKFLLLTVIDTGHNFILESSVLILSPLKIDSTLELKKGYESEKTTVHTNIIDIIVRTKELQHITFNNYKPSRFNHPFSRRRFTGYLL